MSASRQCRPFLKVSQHSAMLLQALTPIQMATAATESYPWWPDILAMLNAACEGASQRS